MIHRIEIPNWRPCRDNELVYRHWALAAKRKKLDAQMVGIFARDVPHALGKRRVSLEISLEGKQKQADPLAYAKSLCDALVKCRMLVDDNSNLMEWGGVTWTRGGTASTVIVLEDIEA